MGTAAACSNDRFAGLAASMLVSTRRVLGERAVAGAVDLVARLELGHVLADGLDRSGEGPARVGRLGRANAEARRGASRTAGRSCSATCPCRRWRRPPARAPRRRRSWAWRSPRVGARLGRRAVAVLDDRLHRLHSDGDGRGLASGSSVPACMAIPQRPGDPTGSLDWSARYWCTSRTHTAPSPAADATRLVESRRTSPTANTPGTRGLEWQARRVVFRWSGHDEAPVVACDV